MSSAAATATLADLLALRKDLTNLGASKRECRRDMAERLEVVRKALVDRAETEERHYREINDKLAVLTKMVAGLAGAK